VKDGEELTFDYGDASGRGNRESKSDQGEETGEGLRTRCLCGSANCRGFMPFDETL
jgi:hypothetical protein